MAKRTTTNRGDGRTKTLDGMPDVATAMRDARITADARGLMPLDEARRWLDGRKAFRKGDGEMIDGTFVLESDRTWAALLSLDDAAELLDRASRLAWQFHVRGRDNVALHQRYGDAILPWLRSRLKNHVLYNIPWCVLPCLLEIGTEDALRLALEVRAVHELLPGQPALGGGPGAFAHDEVERGNEPTPEVTPDEAQAFLGPGDGLDVARAWLVKHPEMGPAVEMLAKAGDVRAAALLDRLRAAEALPKKAQAILDEAETIDEPPGPPWSIAEMDEAAQNYDMPLWDNAHYTMAAMKVSGFVSREGDVLYVECLTTSPRHDEWIHWSGFAYGPGAKKKSSGQELADPKGDELENIELADDGDCVSGISMHIELREDDDSRIVPVPLPMEEQILSLKRPITGKKIEVRADWHLPRSFAELGARARKELACVTAREALLVSLARRHPEPIFAEESAILERCKGPAKKLFSFTDLEWPAAGEPASTSIDLRTMIAALKARKKITRLPGKANSRPEHWLASCADMRSYEGGTPWPDGESPIAEERPAKGPGVSPHWSWLIARGYPHGAMLMHASAWNQKGMAEQTVPYLVNAALPAMQVFWPRRAATMWARAVGSPTKKWAADDPGVAKAGANDAVLRTNEAVELVASFVEKELGAPRHVGSDFVDVLEALVGGAETVDAFVEAMKGVKLAGDRPALAGALFELGFVLLRLGERREKATKKVAKLLTKAMLAKPTDVSRALDLVLNGRVGAERSARTEVDYAFVGGEDRAWAKKRILAAERSRPSAYLVAIAGDALIDMYVARAASEDTFLPAQLGKIGGARAVRALLELHAHEAMRGAIEQAFEARPEGKSELERALAGDHPAAARAVVEAMAAK